jgi:hypothetical protein
MPRRQGRLLRAERAPGSSECTSGTTVKRVRANTTTTLFTVRSARRSALSISGYSSVTTAVCLARLS